MKAFPLFAVAALASLAACSPPADSGWSGYAEGEYVYVASPIAGALTQLAVQRGDDVKRGATLFVLDAVAERAAREEAAARAIGAGAQAADLQKGKREQEVAVVQAQLAQAQAQAIQARNELARQEGLVAQGFVSASHLDDVRAAARLAQARVAELGAQLRVARLPARSDEREAAAARTAAARFALEQARWREQQKVQAAPADARVAETYFRPGEWVGAGQPVVSLLPPGAVKARFFVPEGELGAIAVGQAVRVRCDGCAAEVPARISFIATQAEYTPPVIYSNSQRAKLVFMVEARADAAGAARLRPGQPVEVHRAASAPQ
ncbi:MAG: HlyD family efflux transporter periplasmic adaptor subunit [Caldimonas sp.]